MNKSNKAIRSGRPPGSDADRVRNLLLEAARLQFSGSEFKAVSIKRIATAAGVNGAMVHYYFGDKKGLYLAMVEQLFTPLAASLEGLQNRHHESIEDFIVLYTKLLAENPWWPNFVIREVLFGEDEIRSEVLEKLGKFIAPHLLKMIVDEVDDGHFRADLQPPLALLSLMGMTVFPFIARNLTVNALGISINEDNAQMLAEHTSKLFLQGVMTRSGEK